MYSHLSVTNHLKTELIIWPFLLKMYPKQINLDHKVKIYVKIKINNTKISFEMDFKGYNTITFIYVSTLFISGNLFYKSLKSTS